MITPYYAFTRRSYQRRAPKRLTFPWFKPPEPTPRPTKPLSTHAPGKRTPAKHAPPKGKSSFGFHRSQYGAVSKRPAAPTVLSPGQVLKLAAERKEQSRGNDLSAAVNQKSPHTATPAPLTAELRPVEAQQASDAAPVRDTPVADQQFIQEVELVLNYSTAVTQPSSGPVLTAAPVAVFWAGRSDTPGLANTINLKDSAVKLSAARANKSSHLIDPTRVRIAH